MASTGRRPTAPVVATAGGGNMLLGRPPDKGGANVGSTDVANFDVGVAACATSISQKRAGSLAGRQHARASISVASVLELIGGFHLGHVNLSKARTMGMTTRFPVGCG